MRSAELLPEHPIFYSKYKAGVETLDRSEWVGRPNGKEGSEGGGEERSGEHGGLGGGSMSAWEEEVVVARGEGGAVLAGGGIGSPSG